MKKSREQNTQITFNAIGRKQWNGYNANWYPRSTSVYKGTQITESEGHVRSRDGKYRAGGPFFSVRIRVDIPVRHISGESWHSEPHVINGPICCARVPNDLSEHYGIPIASTQLGSLDTYGAEAVAAVDPTNPNADLGTALGDTFSEGRLPIPIINSWRQRTSVAKKAGSEYLNAVFGWLPLVDEIKSVGQSVRDGNRILENYDSNSGTNVHREFEFPDENSETYSVISTNACAKYADGLSIGPTFDVNDATVSVHSKKTVKRWFSGAFTYAAGGKSNVAKCLGYGSDADKLFGVALTPDLVWELTPWSWAVDWFSNADAVISNASAMGLAGLVMRYGYIMEETSIVDTYSMSHTGLYGVGGTVPPAKVTYTVKRRTEANPFGFGVKWEGLSPAQLAITAALGITHLR